MAAGRRPRVSRWDYRRVEQAVQRAEAETGLQFAVYLGPAGPSGSRDEAERLFQESGLDGRPAALVLVDPEHRRVDVVTAPGAQSRIPDEAAGDAVQLMTERFAAGDLAGGIVVGIERLAAAAGRGRPEAGSEPLPDVIGEPPADGDEA